MWNKADFNVQDIIIVCPNMTHDSRLDEKNILRKHDLILNWEKYIGCVENKS